MKNLSIAVPDSTFEKFCEIQERKGFKNQSDTLVYVVDKAYELEKEKEAEK